MPREIVYSEDLRRRMQSGVDKFANGVKITLFRLTEISLQLVV